MAETLQGVVERITFHNLDTGFAVLRVRAGSRGPLVTLVGNTASVVAGEQVTAVGSWGIDRDHGRQFKADSIESVPPHTPEGLIKYLGSGLIKGIGPSYAKRIVAAFGDKTLEIIDQSPMHLTEVKGIGPQRVEKIRKSWEEQRGVRDVMVFLQSYGIGIARAVRIYKTYGRDAVDLIKANPYRLTADIWGVGFKLADELARRLGVPPDSPHRARAAVRFVLQQCQSQGHVGYPEALIVSETAELATIEPGIIEEAVEKGREDDEWVREMSPDDLEAFGGENWLFAKPMFLAELGVARSLNNLRQGGHPLAGIDAQAAVKWASETMGVELATGQRRALEAACRDKVLVVTGGPGVGKTTIVRGVLKIFLAKGQRVGLTAPTGRAAKRLSESTGREAITIHRLLEFDPGLGQFKKNRENPLDVDLLVVDETSMVDNALMNSLLKAVPPWACLILVGDVDQLPSVGPGAILADVIDSGTVPVARLTEVFRQAASSYIVRAAHAVNEGREPEPAPGPTGDFFMVEEDDPEKISQKILTMVRDRIPARFGLDPLRDVQILSPMNKSAVGVQALNHLLQESLNPQNGRDQVERYGTAFRAGDKVMQTHNNYQREVYNGDIGRVQAIDKEEQQLLVEFDGRSVAYEFSDLDELTLAYATSIHKSQGSEYPAVVVPVHTQHFVMLKRNLIYTAITRGKTLVVLVGSKKALGIALRAADRGRRCTLLQSRLRHQAAGKEFHSPPEAT